jgi:biopolymer transport protein ExbD
MSAGHGKKRGIRLPQADDHIDLVPLIDCVFLILLFFILVGRLSVDQRAEQITVPPTKTAVKFDETKGKWGREVINVFGSTKDGDPPRNTIKLGQYSFSQQGVNDYSGYQKLRDLLNSTYDRAEKYEDPKIKGLMLPKVIVEIRADSDAEYRLVQEIQQVLTDTMDLTTMQPKKSFDPKLAKPFVNLDFTTRKTTDRM